MARLLKKFLNENDVELRYLLFKIISAIKCKKSHVTSFSYFHPFLWSVSVEKFSDGLFAKLHTD